MWESTGGSIPLSSRRVRAKRSREGVPAFCMITFCTIHICTIGCYEWASVVCRKAQVVQSLCPYIHGVSSLVETLYGIWILARVIGQSPFPRGKLGPRSLTLSPFLYPSLLSGTRISTIPSSHATGPFTPHFRPSDQGKFLVETVIFA